MFLPPDLPPGDPPPRPAYVLVQAVASVEDQLVARAEADGWSASQANWIGKLGVARTPGASATSKADVDAAYTAGRQALTVAYFDNALASGKSRQVAFLTVIDLEKQVMTRAHLAPPDYSDEALQKACDAVELANRKGLSSNEQIEAGFEVLRLLAAKPR